MTKIKKINQRKTYKCKYCQEYFRLKMSLVNHKCKEKPKRKRND